MGACENASIEYGENVFPRMEQQEPSDKSILDSFRNPWLIECSKPPLYSIYECTQPFLRLLTMEGEASDLPILLFYWFSKSPTRMRHLATTLDTVDPTLFELIWLATTALLNKLKSRALRMLT